MKAIRRKFIDLLALDKGLKTVSDLNCIQIVEEMQVGQVATYFRNPYLFGDVSRTEIHQFSINEAGINAVQTPRMIFAETEMRELSQ